jgi:hypothetical protein
MNPPEPDTRGRTFKTEPLDASERRAALHVFCRTADLFFAAFLALPEAENISGGAGAAA